MHHTTELLIEFMEISHFVLKEQLLFMHFVFLAGTEKSSCINLIRISSFVSVLMVITSIS